MCRIAVAGAGHVGLTTAACLAKLGHDVVCADIDRSKLDRIRAGDAPLKEPGLAELVEEGQAKGRLRFVHGNRDAVIGAEFLFVCVPTPMGSDGAADLKAVHSVLSETRDLIGETIVIMKSTVPPGTTAALGAVSSPEFLREGHAVEDFLRPRRVVVGARDEFTALRVAALHPKAPLMITDPTSAELVKYASNSYLAMKPFYVNTLAELDADIDGVTRYDEDTVALLDTAHEASVDFDLPCATIEPHRIVDMVRDAVGPLDQMRLGLLGLASNADVEDTGHALAIAELLAAEGAELTAYDPCVTAGLDIRVVDHPLLAAKDASALVLLAEWPELASLDWPEVARWMHRPVVVDTRNHLPRRALRRAGFTHYCLGRPSTR